MLRLKKILFMLIISCLFLQSCKKTIDYSKLEVDSPDEKVINSNSYNLNFVSMHNFVIDSLQSELTPFFYIVEGGFDIDGDNDKRIIEVKCKCMDGCVKDDVDLFFSMVLNYIGIDASIQDYRFKAPTVLEDGSYNDFGTVFDIYSLKLYAVTESGQVLRNDTIKNGEKIPIDPRYIKES